MSNAQAIYMAILEKNNCGEGVIVHGTTYALHEQNGGWSSLFTEAGEELLSVSPQGDIWREADPNDPKDGHEIIANFGEQASVVVTGELAPWLHRTADGDIIGDVTP